MRYSTEVQVEIMGVSLPLKIYREKRRNFRYSITKRGVHLRMPFNAGPLDLLHHMAKIKEWIEQLMKTDPEVFRHFITSGYHSGKVLQIGERTYTLQIAEEDRRTHTAWLENGTIMLRLAQGTPAEGRVKVIRTLISRVVAADFLPEIKSRVYDLNKRTVNRPIRGVYLKYNTSNWGSCSTQGNINLSTRLLFAPRDVQDCVIVHELVHLVEHNHSDRFWGLLKQYVPDYETHEAWLREHSHRCQF